MLVIQKRKKDQEPDQVLVGQAGAIFRSQQPKELEAWHFWRICGARPLQELGICKSFQPNFNQHHIYYVQTQRIWYWNHMGATCCNMLQRGQTIQAARCGWWGLAPSWRSDIICHHIQTIWNVPATGRDAKECLLFLLPTLRNSCLLRPPHSFCLLASTPPSAKRMQDPAVGGYGGKRYIVVHYVINKHRFLSNKERREILSL